MRIVVHGGAGSPPEEPPERQAVLEEAAAAGSEAAAPTGAVCAAVRVLESDPRFNAGVGSAVQSDGAIRTDAGLMTDDPRAGAACGMPGVEHAVSAARAVLEETPHVLVAGPKAVELAGEFGVETGRDLWSDRNRERWAEADAPADASSREQLAWLESRFGSGDDEDDEGDYAAPSGSSTPDAADRAVDPPGTDPDGDPHDHDTVGAVARDGDRFAAATSTGGRWFALAGRVGDVPQIGSGFYCSSAGGASATGAGEEIAKCTLSRRAVDLLESGHSAPEAARTAIEEFGAESADDAVAGVIVMGEDGVGSAYNSELMQTAVASD
ncbi:asparaginase [Halobacteriales archaeon QS_8_69_26]|nr:MAG: asparaginase [Halobacteriales archaeon QS_8_69_26]